MLLAIDAGNSFVKWGYHDGNCWRTPGVAPLLEWCANPSSFLDGPPREIVLANVAGPPVLSALRQCFPTVPLALVQASAEACGVRNHYQPPERLGADRWAALIAARALLPQDCVVVSLGTALTADALTAEGDFLGGMIAPGMQLMRASLDAATHALNNTPGQLQDFPQQTADAIESGVLHALLGVIDAVATRLHERSGAPVSCVLGGGDAARIAPYLNRPTQVVDNLVLQGLLRLAHHKERP